jgi:hypothetical protein
MNSDRDLENLLRSAMRDETDRIEPTNHLQDILRRTARPARSARRRGWVIGIAGAGLVAASVTTAVWIGEQTAGNIPPGPVASVRPPVNVLVYYVQANGSGKYPARIYPEQHRVTFTGDIGFDAVSALFTTPPTDPDYSSLWESGSVDGVTEQPGLITVDLSAGASVIGGQREAAVHVALQQIVYTVQHALDSRDPVRILISGSPPSGTAQPLQADPARVIEGAIVINSPGQGTTVQSPVTVEGDASVFEGTVSWQVLQSGRVVRQGYTTASAGQVFSPYSFEVDLDPGNYTLRVDEASAANGSPMFVETKRFTVE